ncbi:Phage terminase-like protein%2C large subunit [uncultured Clostridium sp.]|nr:Phage terminase-like protein%2C large subunit [uncultured Clostridium sp.]
MMTMKSCKKIIPEIQNYIDLVRSGKIEVCKEQIQLVDFVEKCFEEEDIYVNEEELRKYLSLEKYFPFELLEWEVFCFALHNCTYKSNGRLRFPDLFILVGRGAGKNGYLSFEDFCLISQYNSVKYYHIDICANNEEQAMTSFNDVYNVLEDNKNKLSKHFEWNKEIIRNKKTKSELRFRTSNAKTKDGGRPGKIDFDEYHAYEDYKAINVFTTGLGKKKNPRKTITTTNGDVRDGPLDKLIGRAEQILKGAVSDNGMLPFICRLDDKKEVDNPKMWDKANPSLHKFPDLQDTLHKEYIDYKEDPISNSAFMTKRMNIPQGNKDAEVTSWDNILLTNREVPNLEGASCTIGFDYSKLNDFLSVGLLFLKGGTYYWVTHSWFCKNSRDKERIKAPIQEWAEQGLITIVDDVEISPDLPCEWLQEQLIKYNLEKTGVDNFRYALLSKALKNIGIDGSDKKQVKIVGPSDVMKIVPVIDSAFNKHKIVWGDNPLMRWFTNNTKLTDKNLGNYVYDKIEPKSRKTDGFMAFVHAMIAAQEVLEDEAENGLYFIPPLVF